MAWEKGAIRERVGRQSEERAQGRKRWPGRCGDGKERHGEDDSGKERRGKERLKGRDVLRRGRESHGEVGCAGGKDGRAITPRKEGRRCINGGHGSAGEKRGDREDGGERREACSMTRKRRACCVGEKIGVSSLQ